MVASALLLVVCSEGTDDTIARDYLIRRDLEGIRNYGFITRFDVDEEKARSNIRQLYNDFGIVDFQFYDAFASYSQQMTPDDRTWVSKASTCFTSHARLVHAATIRAYTDEIRKIPGHRGRSWFYVQAVGADEPFANVGDVATPYLRANGSQIVLRGMDNAVCLYVYRLTGAWAKHMVDLWAPMARNLGFDGIHWDQLGAVSDDPGQNVEMAAGVRAFLLQAGETLKSKWDLRQTMNFVDGFGWHPSLYDVNTGEGLVEFPYWECWSDTTEWMFWNFFNFSQPGLARVRPHAVFARYPEPSCCGNHVGSSADDNIWARWKRAASACSTYLVLGDGRQRLVQEYFPASTALTDFAHAAMVMASMSTPLGCSQRVDPTRDVTVAVGV